MNRFSVLIYFDRLHVNIERARTLENTGETSFQFWKGLRGTLMRLRRRVFVVGKNKSKSIQVSGKANQTLPINTELNFCFIYSASRICCHSVALREVHLISVIPNVNHKFRPSRHKLIENHVTSRISINNSTSIINSCSNNVGGDSGWMLSNIKLNRWYYLYWFAIDSFFRRGVRGEGRGEDLRRDFLTELRLTSGISSGTWKVN